MSEEQVGWEVDIQAIHQALISLRGHANRIKNRYTDTVSNKKMTIHVMTCLLDDMRLSCDNFQRYMETIDDKSKQTNKRSDAGT